MLCAQLQGSTCIVNFIFGLLVQNLRKVMKMEVSLIDTVCGLFADRTSIIEKLVITVDSPPVHLLWAWRMGFSNLRVWPVVS